MPKLCRRWWRQARLAVAFAAALSCALSIESPAHAEPQVILPPGLLVEGTVFRRNGTSVPFIETGVDANGYLFSVPPTQSFLNEAEAAVVYTSEPLQFIRFYTDGVTSPLGSFIVRPDIIRGLSATEIRDFLALPYMPDSLTIVLIPAGTCVMSGVVAPILGDFPADPPAIPTPGPWGHGGVEQSYIIGKTGNQNCEGAQFLPAGDYVNQQALGAHALWYEPRAGGGNPGAVAAMLDHLPPATPYGDLYNVYNALDLLNFGEAYRLRAALAQLGGQTYADLGIIEAKTAQGFSDLLITRLASRRALAAGANEIAASSKFADAGSETPGSGTRMWVSASGGIGQLAGDASDGISNADYHTAAIAAGMDYQPSATWTIGAGFGYARNDVSLAGLSEAGTIDNYQAALYAGYAEGPWYFDVAAGYAFAAGAVDRSIAFPGVRRSTNGDADADIFLSAFEAGYALGGGNGFATIPFARLQATSVNQSSFSETGGGAISLDVGGETYSSVRSILGMALDLSPPEHGGPLGYDLTLRVGWAHEFADNAGEVTASFVGAPAGRFTVQGAAFGRDSLAVEFTSAVALSEGVGLTMTYDGDVASHSATHMFSGGINLTW